MLDPQSAAPSIICSLSYIGFSIAVEAYRRRSESRGNMAGNVHLISRRNSLKTFLVLSIPFAITLYLKLTAVEIQSNIFLLSLTPIFVAAASIIAFPAYHPDMEQWFDPNPAIEKQIRQYWYDGDSSDQRYLSGAKSFLLTIEMASLMPIICIAIDLNVRIEASLAIWSASTILLAGLLLRVVEPITGWIESAAAPKPEWESDSGLGYSKPPVEAEGPPITIGASEFSRRIRENS